MTEAPGAAPFRHRVLVDRDCEHYVEVLRSVSHAAYRVTDFGLPDTAPDELILATARSEELPLVTCNRRDFRRLARQMRDHHGLILSAQPALRSAFSRADLERALLRLLSQRTPDELRGRIVGLGEWVA